MYWTELVNTKAIFVEQQYNYLSNNFWLGSQPLLVINSKAILVEH